MSLTRNASFSLISSVLQIGVILVTVPIYLRLIGPQRYGVIVIVWLLFDYFQLFNFGLDKAVTAMLARLRQSLDESSILFGTAIAISLLAGAIGMIVMFAAIIPILSNWMGIGPELIAEAGWSIRFIALLLPLWITASVFRGLLQAHERFFELSVAQFAMAVAFQIAPLAMAKWLGPDLQTVLFTGAIARSTLPLVMIFLALRRGPRMRMLAASREWARKLTQYGFWTSVTNIVSPLIVNLDRYIVASKLGPAAVGLYNVPLNLIMRVQILPTSLQSALFPRMSMSGEDDRGKLSRDGVVGLGIIMAPLLVCGAVFIDPFLKLWIGDFVAPELSQVGEILIVGVWFNSLAYVPYAQLQAEQRPNLIARLHVLEILPFVALLWFAIGRWGIVGAATAWSLRAIVDSLLLFAATGLTGVICWTLLFPTGLLVLLVATLLPHETTLLTNLALGAGCVAAILIWSATVAPASLRTLVLRAARWRR
ncbi:flippase [Terrarubrum flagellatum]|uniref:flippase n=1 Tax=Terrirubrum flagellatum TaxID=2895980 RepID=UPI0031451398